MSVPALFVVDRSERGLLALTGRDRQSFLQGMVTNDVAALVPGQGVYAFHLDPTGHILSDLRVLCRDDRLLLDVEPGFAEPLVASLEHHLIMERCRIADLSGTVVRALVGGSRAIDALAASTLAAEGDSALRDDVLAVRVHLASVPTFELIGPGDAVAARVAALGAEPLDASVLDALRVEAGIPRGGVDFDRRVLAPETGQQARAIHLRKGCYIGQEIVARIDARGHTNRALVGFFVDSVVAPETPVHIDGQEVGRVTSSVVSPTLGVPIALGYLRHAHGAPQTAVRIGEATGQVAALPFVASA
jgi:folate-binding protein YgfZ